MRIFHIFLEVVENVIIIVLVFFDDPSSAFFGLFVVKPGVIRKVGFVRCILSGIGMFLLQVGNVHLSLFVDLGDGLSLIGSNLINSTSLLFL